MSEPDDIPNRVTRLEGEMAVVHFLAVSTDHDVSNVQEALRAHVGVLNALRETQLDHGRDIKVLRTTQLEQGKDISHLRTTQLEQGKDISQLRTTQLEHSRTLTGHGQALGRVEERLDRIDAGIAELLIRRREEPGEG